MTWHYELVAVLRLRLTPDQRRSIERLAARERVPAEDAVLRAVEQALARRDATVDFPPGTPFHGVDDLLDGIGDGPADLSTNRAYRDGLGK